MTRNEFTFPSADGKTGIHAVEWLPEGHPRAVLQVSHGVAEYVLRYEPLAEYFTARGFAVAGHDHLGHGGSVAPGGARLYFGPKGRRHAPSAAPSATASSAPTAARPWNNPDT